AVAGFTLAPAAGAVTALAQPTMTSGCAALAAALCGATLALLPRQAPGGDPSGDPSGCGARHRAITAGGLSLAAGAIQLRALLGARTAPAVHGAMVTAAGRWALVAAAVTAAVALAMAVTTIRRPRRSSGHLPAPAAPRDPARH